VIRNSHDGRTIFSVAYGPQIPQLNLSFETLGNFHTLPERFHAEVTASKTVVPFVAPVGAWSHNAKDQVTL
jgi:hypothetical protein